jgi:hypothetical protein
MEIVLMIVTVVSLVLAIGMSVVGWTLLRADRRRSAARVEALGALADAADLPDAIEIERPAPIPQIAPRALPAPARFEALDVAPSSRDAHDHRADTDPWPEAWEVEPEPWDVAREAEPVQFRERTPRAAAPTRVERRPPAVDDLLSGDIFGAAVVERRAPLRRWLALGAVMLVMAAGAGIVYFVYRPALLNAASSGDPAPGAALPANARPLELLSLTHATDPDGSFSLTGLVQNPMGGAPIRGVVVVVYLFDRGGNYFATGKAPLDLTALQPGNESPFIVRVPNANHVGRFRVGFRLEDGRVVAHVDRRGQSLDGTMEVEDPARTPNAARTKGTPGA